MSETELEVSGQGVVEVMEPGRGIVPRRTGGVASVPASVIQYRDKLVRDYHGGVSGLIERLRKDGKSDYEALLVALIDEIVKESDNLLGNGLVATHNGDLRDASVISVKRAEIIEKALRAVQDKQKFEQSRGTFDVDSPAMMEVFRFFMKKSKDTLEHMDVDTEMRDLFFRTFGDISSNWKKELKERLQSTSRKDR